MPGLLADAFDDPREQALLTLGLGLMGTPGGFARGLSTAGQQALGVYSAGRERQRTNAREDARDIQAQAAFQLQQQMAQLQLQQAQAEAQKRAALQAALERNRLSPTQVGMGAGAAAGDVGPSPGNLQRVQASAPGFNRQRYLGDLWGIDPTQAMSMETALRKEQPKLSKLEPMRDAQGRMVNVAVFEDGTSKVLPYGVRPDIALQNMGGQTVAIDKNAVQNGNIWQMSATPDAQLSAQTQRRGQDMVDARADQATAASGNVEYKQDAQGNWMALPKRITSPGAQITPIPVGSASKTAVDSRDALSLIADAKELVPKATSSGVGQGVDWLGNQVGMSSAGADNAAKLRVLGGALMLKTPRLEGPQSDADRKLYAELAGRVGDAGVPVSQRLAALQQMEKMHTRTLARTGKPGAAPWAPAPGGGGAFKFLGVD